MVVKSEKKRKESVAGLCAQLVEKKKKKEKSGEKGKKKEKKS
jgi:hypothetical protein